MFVYMRKRERDDNMRKIRERKDGSVCDVSECRRDSACMAVQVL